GHRFSLLRALWDHPHRPQWHPGGGGLCLHTVLVHPNATLASGSSVSILAAISGG
ncbi:MAG: exo-alpha-sialidase, partial [Acidimicrobiia bacterium]|nr:exo-alpha-sialidase [Acidimicrobiia bacterium]